MVIERKNGRSVWFCVDCGRCGEIDGRRVAATAGEKRTFERAAYVLGAEDHAVATGHGCHARIELVASSLQPEAPAPAPSKAKPSPASKLRSVP